MEGGAVLLGCAASERAGCRPCAHGDGDVPSGAVRLLLRLLLLLLLLLLVLLLVMVMVPVLPLSR